MHIRPNQLNRCHFSAFVPLVIVGLAVASCQSGSSTEMAQAAPVDSTATKPAAQTVSLSQAQYDMAAIQLGQPTLRPLSTTLKLNGVIDVPAQNRVSVSVPMGGYIRSIQLEPGMRVRKGQPLVVLENPDYIQLQQDYLDTRAKLEYADLDYARQEELSRDNVNALKTFQQARATRQSLQAQLAGLRQRLTMLRINPATLSPARLTRTITIPAPVSGYVTDVPVNNGRFVNPADVLVQLTDVSHLHVQLNVFEKDLSKIRVGQTVRFGLGADAGDRLPQKGTIFLIGKAFTADRTVAVLAHPDREPTTNLTPGGYVSAQVEVKTQPLLALPEAAVVSFGGSYYGYILEKKQGNPVTYHFRQVPIQPGIRENGYVAVTLPAGIDPARTPVVVGGAYSLLAKLNNSEDE
ncbi:efflux RND transporter periplasmic adaptor subunit [Spirosoma utsteinense]|uniref:Cobalt-zinc-cadmium efflux system membrane fusion protein n=1 Tax=Spirosoma utsteinense TaxID=2585773 RepID=A0ABR6W9F8_9BACT|nr:efflux RND transporter periplasmic adaptor subunit [Spirosoma utsteinense]MBC3787953.1 cobalt-zinc-cadmium efflux system membrane fusion protein [Spirosoma utsteinense]MBC3793142.1 cobalt-zinc-cadmium efflux system membrane fusion protein [Spirosoma utsteinense]